MTQFQRLLLKWFAGRKVKRYRSKLGLLPHSKRSSRLRCPGRCHQGIRFRLNVRRFLKSVQKSAGLRKFDPCASSLTHCHTGLKVGQGLRRKRGLLGADDRIWRRRHHCAGQLGCTRHCAVHHLSRGAVRTQGDGRRDCKTVQPVKQDEPYK